MVRLGLCVTAFAIAVVSSASSCSSRGKGPDAGAGARAENASRKPRVVVLGFDGVDPDWVDRWMAEGKLPHLQALKARGSYGPLRSTNPPQSPVAWTTFATGTPPARHGIFDFIRRDPTTYRPFVGTTEVTEPRVGPPRARNLRRGEPFWKRLGDQGVRVVALNVPYSFPPDPMGDGRMLSGLGVPDLRGTNSTFTYFGEDVTPARAAKPPGGGSLVPLTVAGDAATTHLDGPLPPEGGRRRAASDVAAARNETRRGPRHPHRRRQDGGSDAGRTDRLGRAALRGGRPQPPGHGPFPGAGDDPAARLHEPRQPPPARAVAPHHPPDRMGGAPRGGLRPLQDGGLGPRHQRAERRGAGRGRVPGGRRDHRGAARAHVDGRARQGRLGPGARGVHRDRPRRPHVPSADRPDPPALRRRARGAVRRGDREDLPRHGRDRWAGGREARAGRRAAGHLGPWLPRLSPRVARQLVAPPRGPARGASGRRPPAAGVPARRRLDADPGVRARHRPGLRERPRPGRGGDRRPRRAVRRGGAAHPAGPRRPARSRRARRERRAGGASRLQPQGGVPQRRRRHRAGPPGGVRGGLPHELGIDPRRHAGRRPPRPERKEVVRGPRGERRRRHRRHLVLLAAPAGGRRPSRHRRPRADAASSVRPGAPAGVHGAEPFLNAWQQPLVVGAACVFALWLLVKLARGPGRRRRAAPGAQGEFRVLKLRARKAKDVAERAALLVQAGEVARTGLHRPDLAVAYYLRALRFDPSNRAGFESTREVLGGQRRWRRLERVYWRLLGTLPTDSALYVEVLERLVELYSGPFRHPVRAKALRRLAERLPRGA